jgi:hypothetical protein
MKKATTEKKNHLKTLSIRACFFSPKTFADSIISIKAKTA